MIPKKFRDLNAFIAGEGFAGRVTELTPPKLTLKTEEFRGGGMDAPVEMDMGMDALVADMSAAEWLPPMLRAFGRDGTQMEFRGAFRDDGGRVSAVVVSLTGKVKELDSGSWKPGEGAALKATITCTYYKLQVDGETLHEIDVVNMKRIIGGEDQMEAVRQALGL